MLQYLSGIKNKTQKQKPSSALIKNRIVKNLLKKSPPALVLKAAKKAPLIVQAQKRNRIIKQIERKSPLTANRIKKATVLKQRQQAFTRAGNPPVMVEMEPVQNLPETPKELIRFMDQMPPEQVEFRETEEINPDFIDPEFEPEEGEEGEEVEEGEAMEGIYYPSEISGKRAAKKAAKPRNVRKDLSAQSKAQARLKRAEQPKGEVFKKLIDTGTQILDKTLLPGAFSKGGTQSNNLPDPPQTTTKPGFFANIPTPVKIGGAFLLAFAAYKAFKPKN